MRLFHRSYERRIFLLKDLMQFRAKSDANIAEIYDIIIFRHHYCVVSARSISPNGALEVRSA